MSALFIDVINKGVEAGEFKPTRAVDEIVSRRVMEKGLENEPRVIYEK